jgi:nitrogen-specific signal transduction histidine kinase
LHVIGTNIISAYFARKFAITDLCALYYNKVINDQWKVIINSLKDGEIIMSEESPPRLLFANTFAEKIAKDICRVIHHEAPIQELLAESTIKIIYNERDSDHSIHKKSFTKFIEEYSENIYGKSDCFLDIPELLVELKVNRVIFDNNEAKLVSLTDCTSARSLEKIKSECKYKTILISNISHELRTPVNAILGTLDLVKDFIPKESAKLLEISKECCNMITSHINDLTVTVNLNIGLWQVIRRETADN